MLFVSLSVIVSLIFDDYLAGLNSAVLLYPTFMYFLYLKVHSFLFADFFFINMFDMLYFSHQIQFFVLFLYLCLQIKPNINLAFLFVFDFTKISFIVL